MEWTYYEMKLHSQSVSFSSDITESSQQYVFCCIYKLQNFIPKSFKNALIEIVQTLPTSRQLWEAKAPLSDFQKPSSCRGIRKKVKSIMTSLRCYDNCTVNITLVTTNSGLYLIQLWQSFFGSIVNGDIVNAQTWAVLPLKNPVEPP